MKKIILTLIFILSIAFSSFAQYTPASWGFDSSLACQGVYGVTYSGSHCAGKEISGGVAMVIGDPYNYYLCDNTTMIAYLKPCPDFLIFNPATLVCEIPELVDTDEYYPSFPWSSTDNRFYFPESE